MVSVVIPAYNEAGNIPRTLESLAAQTTAWPFEVIVVDNASTDQTGAAAKRFSQQINLTVIQQPVKGRGAARAAGFRQARGDIIMSTDADTAVPTDWIDRLIAGFSDPKIAAVTGTCQINDCARWTNRIFNWFQPNAMRLYRMTFGHFWLTGSNFAIRRSAYLKSGGFTPAVNDLEDIELGFRVRKVGRIKFIRDVPVTSSGHRFQGGLVKGLWPYIRAFVGRFYLKKEIAR